VAVDDPGVLVGEEHDGGGAAQEVPPEVDLHAEFSESDPDLQQLADEWGIAATKPMIADTSVTGAHQNILCTRPRPLVNPATAVRARMFANVQAIPVGGVSGRRTQVSSTETSSPTATDFLRCSTPPPLPVTHRRRSLRASRRC
jgi:hypothetical protein